MDKTKVSVVYSTDHNFIMPTRVAVTSMLECSTDVHCSIYIMISDNVTEADREAIRQSVAGHDATVTFLEVGKAFAGSFEIRGISVATYYRLLIPWLLPDVDKIIYVDGDIVFKQSIGLLWEAAKGDFWMWGVQAPSFTLDHHLADYIKKFGISPDGYINGGVQVINSKALRDNDLKPLYMQMAQKKYTYQDQDIVNLACAGHIGLLPGKFNSTQTYQTCDRSRSVEMGVTTAEEFDEAALHPVIIHFTGMKPWKGFCYKWNDWWMVYRRCPFYDPQLERTVSQRIISPRISLKDYIKSIIRYHRL